MKSSATRGNDDAAAIPPSAKTVVQNLKEIVKNHSDDEIYAALKECHMDPNDAVHILMHQDTFHEVKRKRDRRRENGSANDTEEIAAKSHIRSSKLLDHGVKRANYVPRQFLNDGKHKLLNAREDGSHQTLKFTSTTPQAPSTMRFRLSNMGQAGMQKPSQTHAVVQNSRGKVSGYSVLRNSKVIGTTLTAVKSSMLKSASTRPGATEKQDLGALQTNRPNKKQEGQGNDAVSSNVVALKSVQRSNLSASHQSLVSDAKNSPGRPHENVRSHGAHLHQTFSEEQKRASSGTLGARQTYYNSRASYYPHQRLSGSQRALSGLEWKPKPPPAPAVAEVLPSETPPAEEVGVSLPPIALPAPTIEVPTGETSKLEGLNLQNDRAVIIPEHLQVPEAECAGLSFGSFDTDFGISFSAGLHLNDDKSMTGIEISANLEVIPVQPGDSSMAELSPLETSTPSHPPLLSSTTTETFAASSDAVLSMPPMAVRSAEISKPEVPMQQVRQFPYVPSVPGYQGLGLVPQLPSQNDTAESQLLEISRAPNFVTPADPAQNYYGPVFRPGPDVEPRYQFLSSHGGSKFSGNATLMNGQTLSSSQEQSQNAGIHTATLAVGQPSMPVHPYAAQHAGVTLSPYPYGYQYVPSNYAYVHAPYQNNYPGNSGYPQPPVGSNFASSTRIYSSVGTAAHKFPVTPYKLGTGNSPHPLAPPAYGSYATGPSGFAAMNSSVTAGSGSSYNDMVGPQYKENTLYTSSHQVDGSALWVQGPLSRDVSGMQTNSYYNLHNQGQHPGYTHSQTAHAHHAAGFGSYTQSAPGLNNHQLLQQPQALGSVGAGSQAVIFSQPQRGPVNWSSSYSNLLRG